MFYPFFVLFLLKSPNSISPNGKGRSRRTVAVCVFIRGGGEGAGVKGEGFLCSQLCEIRDLRVRLNNLL